MTIQVGVADAVLGTITLTPQGLRCEGPEKRTLERLADDYRHVGLSDRCVIDRMLQELDGDTWAVELPEDKPAR